MTVRRRTTLLVALTLLMALLVPGGIASADGTEQLEPPQGITIAKGSGAILKGTGLHTQPGTIDLVVPDGAAVQQVLLYWQGTFIDPASADDSIGIGGITGPVLGQPVGGPATVFTTSSGADAKSVTYRADITHLGLIVPGLNSVSLSGLTFDHENNGAGLFVIYDDGSGLSTIDVRDGMDFAYGPSSGVLATTVPQHFTVPASDEARTALLHLQVSSVQPGRRNALRLTVGGVTTTQKNVFNSNDGPDWDAVTVPVNIPAGVTDVTAEVVSGNGQDVKRAASLVWLQAALAAPGAPPEAPQLRVAKSLPQDVTQVQHGDELTYTIAYGNDGGGDATDTVLTDELPDGLAFVSCSDDCTHSDGVVAWQLGTVPAGGSGQVTVTVQAGVLDACEICNVASITSPSQGGGPVTSEPLCVLAVPTPDPSTATASGDGYAVHVKVTPSPGIDTKLVEVAASQAGPGSSSDADSLATIPVNPIATVKLLDATTDAEVAPGEATDRTEVTTAAVNLLDGVVTATAVRGVANARSTATGATADTFGSHIEGLKVNGEPVEITTYGQQVTIDGVGVLHIYERSHEAGLQDDDLHHARTSVNMLRLEITGGPFAGSRVVVGHAAATTAFPSGRDCGPLPSYDVLGSARVVGAKAGPVTADLITAGPLPLSGGGDYAELLALNVPSLLQSSTARAETNGGFDGTTALARSIAEVEGLEIGGGAITANAVTAVTQTAASLGGVASDTSGSQIANLVVNGTNVCSSLGLGAVCTPEPNTVYEAPGGALKLILNEQLDGAGNPTTCGPDTDVCTVRMIHVTLLGGDAADIIVSEARSGAHVPAGTP